MERNGTLEPLNITRNGTKRNDMKSNGMQQNTRTIMQKRNGTEKNALKQNRTKRTIDVLREKRNEPERIENNFFRIRFALFRSVPFRSIPESKNVAHHCPQLVLYA